MKTTKNVKLAKEIIKDYAETFTQLKEYDMVKQLTSTQLKAQEIDKAIRLAWSSLESHLPYTHSGSMIRGEDHEFHKNCIKEYAEIISVLSKLY